MRELAPGRGRIECKNKTEDGNHVRERERLTWWAISGVDLWFEMHHLQGHWFCTICGESLVCLELAAKYVSVI